MSWHLVLVFLASAGYGILSSFVPVFNSEVYIVAAQALGVATEVATAVGVAMGQTIGKTAIVLALRNGTRIGWLGRQVDKLRARADAPHEEKPVGRFRRRIRRWSRRLLDLIGDPRWGGLAVFLSGLCAVPPIFAVQFIVPATKMPVWVFSGALFLGRCILFLAVAFGASAVLDRIWP